MTKNDPIPLIYNKILASHNIAITSHLRPDGDSICTSLALAGMVELLGKRARIINHDPTPYPFNQMPEVKRIRIGQVPAKGYDLIILLECANVDEAREVLNTLPLMKEELIDFDIIPLAPYPGFARLFAE